MYMYTIDKWCGLRWDTVEQSLLYLLDSGTKIQLNLVILTCDPWKCIIYNPDDRFYQSFYGIIRLEFSLPWLYDISKMCNSAIGFSFFFETLFQGNHATASNSLDPDQTQQFVRPDLGPNCLQTNYQQTTPAGKDLTCILHALSYFCVTLLILLWWLTLEVISCVYMMC